MSKVVEKKKKSFDDVDFMLEETLKAVKECRIRKVR